MTPRLNHQKKSNTCLLLDKHRHWRTYIYICIYIHILRGANLGFHHRLNRAPRMEPTKAELLNPLLSVGPNGDGHNWVWAQTRTRAASGDDTKQRMSAFNCKCICYRISEYSLISSKPRRAETVTHHSLQAPNSTCAALGHDYIETVFVQ